MRYCLSFLRVIDEKDTKLKADESKQKNDFLPKRFQFLCNNLIAVALNTGKRKRLLFLNNLLFLSSKGKHSKNDLCNFHSMLYRYVNANSRNKSGGNNNPREG